MTTVITGEGRRARLREFGFSQALVDALDLPPGDEVAPALWASNGEVLHQLLEHAYIRERLPAGHVVPVCHVDESSVHYILLVHTGDNQRGTLIDWADEYSEPIRGDVFGFLTTVLVRAWEAAGYSENAPTDDALVDWAHRMGYTAAAELFEGLELGLETQEYKAWLDAFVAQHTHALPAV